MSVRFRMVAAAIAWFAIILQYHLSVTGEGAEFFTATIRYFSFFTMLSNILVALALTLPWLAPASKLGAFFQRPSVRTALAVYVTVASLVYYTLLHKLLDPQGWELFTGLIEHCITPILYFVDWMLFVPRGSLLARLIPWWLIFPLAYGSYALLRGFVTGDYLYPFLDLSRLGFENVLLNMAGLTLAFSMLALLLVGIDRRLAPLEGLQTTNAR